MPQSYEAYYANAVLTLQGEHQLKGPARVKVTVVEEGSRSAGRRHLSPRNAGKGEPEVNSSNPSQKSRTGMV
jgi:hypothetical protein